MAQAGTRIGAKAVYFYRTTAWVDFGDGPIVRFGTSKAIYNNVIAPFDDGDREHVLPGIYHLTPLAPSHGLKARRERQNESRKAVPAGKRKADGSRSMVQAHTERVVMSSRAGGGPTKSVRPRKAA